MIRFLASVIWSGWLVMAVHLMSTAYPSDLPTWIRFVLNGLTALGIWLSAMRGQLTPLDRNT